MEPIITGRSITLIASKYNLPIPGQSKTASVIIAPPKEPERLSARIVTIGGAAFFSACLYMIFFLLIPIVLFAVMKSSCKIPTMKFHTKYAHEPNPIIAIVINGSAMWYSKARMYPGSLESMLGVALAGNI